jgi:adenylylsulfate kinase
MTGCVVWITGIPASGKSTFAMRLAENLRARDVPTCVLDGDIVRAAIVPRPGYDAVSRENFYATLAELAALLARQGLVAVVAATAHLRKFREYARTRAPAFVEVYVKTSQAEAQARDPKGLYAASADGILTDVPGADVAYEPPLSADFEAAGGLDAGAAERVADCVQRLRPAQL